MNLWISIVVIGLIFLLIGFVVFFKNPKSDKNIKSILLVGIFLPLILSYSYAEYFVLDNAFKLSLIDLGGLLILGIISGIFIACYLLIDKIQSD